ncbi:hypothetical protein HHK36_001849 [Tetracentron sinense]|uniref:TF-B3 domain-containing protein n=1 Tax=Tetracentron sinense TaxID=13715 RepID=A0A834ZU37_TETSI|nr:hypothetical protein HHK36_001849 [Tetracentron sinense]
MDKRSSEYTTTTISLNHEKKPRIEENEKKFNMGTCQNRPFSTPESQSLISTSQYHHQGQYQHQNESQSYPFVFSSDNATPPVFPVFPFGIEQNVVDNGVPISVIGGFFNRSSSDKHVGGNGLETSWFWEPKALSRVQEQKPWDSLITKAARSKRKIARRSTKFGSVNKISSGTSHSFLSSCRSTSKKLASYAIVTQNNNDKEEILMFSSPDNKKLKFVLQKELKNSDVSSLGRVVLPKRVAEVKLPKLTVKEGFQLAVREVISTKVWSMRYRIRGLPIKNPSPFCKCDRFWPNNKSRMYVLENTGEFVKQNDLKSGDTILLYEDESKQIFILAKKAEKPISEPLKKEMEEDDNDEETFALPENEIKQEEEVSLTYLKKELKEDVKEEEDKSQVTTPLYGASAIHKSEEIRNGSFDNVTADGTSTQPEKAVVEASSWKDEVMEGDVLRLDGSLVIDFDDCFSELDMLPDLDGSLVIDFDDCFSELDMLPDFDQYDLSLYDGLMEDLIDVGGDNVVVVK